MLPSQRRAMRKTRRQQHGTADGHGPRAEAPAAPDSSAAGPLRRGPWHHSTWWGEGGTVQKHFQRNEEAKCSSRVMPSAPPLPPLPGPDNGTTLLPQLLLGTRPTATTFMITHVRSGDSKLSRRTAHELSWAVCLSVPCGTQVSEAELCGTAQVPPGKCRARRHPRGWRGSGQPVLAWARAE